MVCYGIFCSGQLLFLNNDIIPHKGKKLILDSSCNNTINRVGSRVNDITFSFDRTPLSSVSQLADSKTKKVLAKLH